MTFSISRGLRILPSVATISCQFCRFCPATVGVSCQLFALVAPSMVDGDHQVMTNPVKSRVSAVDTPLAKLLFRPVLETFPSSVGAKC